MPLPQKTQSISLTLLCFLLFHPTFSQSRYSDYTSTDKISVFREEFGASSVSWEGYESGRRSTKIEDGELIFTSFNDNTQVKYRTVSIDWSGDWEIEYAVKWISGKEDSAMDLVWDKESGNSNKYHFGFTAGRKYVLAEYKDGDYEHILKFIPSNNVYKSARNIMTVRKVGRTYYFFVNKILVTTLAYKDVRDDLVGFTVPPKTSIAVDYLYAYQLNKNEVSNTVSAAGTYKSYTSDDITTVYHEDFNTPDSKWEVFKSGERMGKIHNGLLDWISMNDNAQMIWHELDVMDWDRDWQVEIRMKHLIGKPNSSNDLLLNIQENNSKYHFGFTGEGKYSLSEKVGSEYQSIVPFTYSTNVFKDLFNKFTIRKVGREYQFFVNEDLITTKREISISSNKIGFMVPPNSTLQVDYLDVSYLAPKSSTIASSNLPPETNYKRNLERSTANSNRTTNYLNSNISSLIVGKWHGGVPEESEEGYFIFDKESYTSMIVDGETIGGKGYEVDGTEIDLKYEINQTKSPNEIDLVFYSNGIDIGHIKGLINMVNEDTFHMVLANEMGDPRPTKLNNNGSIKVAIFKRVKD